MALLSTQVLPDNTLEEFRIEFNKLVTDVSGLSLGNTFDTQIIFEGTTDDTFETAISVTDPTADRSIVFPNASGNVLLDSANIALGDNIEIQFGDGTDLKIFHDGSNSIIRDNGTGALFLEGSTVSIRDEASSETMADFVSDGAVTLYHDNVAKLATASTGVEVSSSGNTQIGITSTSGIGSMEIGSAASNAAFIDFKTPSSDDFDMRVSSEAAGAGGNITIAGGTFSISGSGETMATFADDGAVSLYHNDAVKLATAATGVTMTGEVTATGFTGTLDGILGGGTPAAATVTTLTSGGNVVSDTDSTDDLGTTGVRWANLFVDAITATDQITATGFTGTLDGILGSGAAAAATVTTLNTSGVVNLNLTTDSSSSTSGALIIDGGVGVAKKLFVGTDLDVDGTANLDVVDIDGAVNMATTALVTGVLTTTATQVATGGITSGSNIVSDTDSTDDLGTTGVRWANLYVDAITATDQITATGFTGTLDGILGSGTAAAATTTTLASTTITASGIIKTDDTTEATSTTDGSLQTDGGLSVAKDIVAGDDVKLLSDSAVLSFGADSEVTLTHVADQGLTLKNTNTGDDKPIILTLQTGETDMAAGETLGEIRFQAPDEGTGTDAILVAAAISARSEGDFSSSSNATKLSFQTGASEAASEKMILASDGDLSLLTDTVALKFGADSEVSLNHVHNVGLHLIGTTATNSYTELKLTDGNAGYAFQVRSDAAQSVATGSFVLNDVDSSTFPIVINEGSATNTLKIDSEGVKVTAISQGPLGGRRNSVMNPCFQINQRHGTNANTTINTYAMDRWRSFGGGSSPAHALSWTTRSDAGEGSGFYGRFQRTADNTAVHVMGIAQGWETIDSKYYAGKEVTLSFRARGGANWSPTSGNVGFNLVGGEGTDENCVGMTNTDTIVGITAAIPQGGGFVQYSGTATVPADKTQLAIQASWTPVGTAGANDYWDVREVQLELGDTVTQFENRGTGEEIQLCQRYCTVVHPATSTAVGNGFARTTTTAYASRPLPVLMRATPTISFSAAADFEVQSRARVDDATGMATSECGPDTIAFVATIGGANLVAGDGMYIRDNIGDGETRIVADAEL